MNPMRTSTLPWRVVSSILEADTAFCSEVMIPLRTRQFPRLSRTEFERAKTISPCSQCSDRVSAPRDSLRTPVFLDMPRRLNMSARLMAPRSPLRMVDPATAVLSGGPDGVNPPPARAKDHHAVCAPQAVGFDLDRPGASPYT